MLLRTSALFIILLLCWGCGDKASEPSTDGNNLDRKAMLTHWVDNIIIPSYDNFNGKFNLMQNEAGAFTTTPNAITLEAFRAAWVGAYLEWQKVELFEFGPADKYALRNYFNIYPASVAGINDNIADPSANLEFASSYPKQGFPALDYLLNGVANTDEDILVYYTTEADGAKRLAYITKVVERMDLLISNVISEWKGTYRTTFINEAGLDNGSSTSVVTNAYVLNYERFIRSGKFGIPSGVMSSSGTPLPEKVEAYYKKDISLQLAKNAHQASVNFFNGVSLTSVGDGPSFKTYLDALGAKDANSNTSLSEIINNQLNTISQELDELSPNLAEQAENNNQAMIDVYTAMQRLVKLIKVDMTSAMSINITYTDNDGD